MSKIVRELDRFELLNSQEPGAIADTEDEPLYLAWDDNPQKNTSAEIVWREHPETGVMHSTVVPYGNATGDLFGTDETAPQCTFWFAVNAVCSGEFALALALIHRFSPRGNLDADGLFDALNSSENADDVREAFPGLETEFRRAQAKVGSSSSFPGNLTTALSDAVSVNEQLETALDDFGRTPRRIYITNRGKRSVYVVVGGSDHGTWVHKGLKRDKETDELVPDEDMIWEGVAYLERFTAYFDGDVEHTEPLARAVILDRNGRKWRTGPMPQSKAIDAAAVWTNSAPEGVGKPAPFASVDVSSCLATLRLASAETFQVAMGWHQDRQTDRWSYNGTTAGVDADGSIPGVWRKPPKVTRQGASVDVKERKGLPAQEATGWPVVPTESGKVQTASTVIPQLRALTPNRLDLHLTLLGTYFAAPLLGLAELPAVHLAAEPESGKSLMTSCYNAMLTSLSVSADHLTISLKDHFSRPGVDGLRRSYNDAVVVLDDAADNEDRKKNEDTRAVVEAAIKGAFGTSGGVLADGEGGADSRRPSRCAVIVTSEGPLTGLGILSRTVSLRMTKSDLTKGVKEKFGGYVDQGLPRQLYAAYIRWLAEALDESGPDALSRRIETHKQRLYDRLGQVRAVDVAGSIYTGLMMFGEFLTENGCRDALASDAEIDKIIKSLVREGKALNREASLGQVAADFLKGELESGRAFLRGVDHLTDPEAFPNPTEAFAVHCGWSAGKYGWETAPGAIHVGYLSNKDEGGKHHVLITEGGFATAWRRNANRAEQPHQVRASWGGDITEPKWRGIKEPSLPGINRKKGQVFAPETLGIGVDHASQQAEDKPKPRCLNPSCGNALEDGWKACPACLTPVGSKAVPGAIERITPPSDPLIGPRHANGAWFGSRPNTELTDAELVDEFVWAVNGSEATWDRDGGDDAKEWLGDRCAASRLLPIARETFNVDVRADRELHPWLSSVLPGVAPNEHRMFGAPRPDEPIIILDASVCGDQILIERTDPGRPLDVRNPRQASQPTDLHAFKARRQAEARAEAEACANVHVLIEHRLRRTGEWSGPVDDLAHALAERLEVCTEQPHATRTGVDRALREMPATLAVHRVDDQVYVARIGATCRVEYGDFADEGEAA